MVGLNLAPLPILLAPLPAPPPPCQVPEADFLRALRAAVETAQQLLEPQLQLAAQTG